MESRLWARHAGPHSPEVPPRAPGRHNGIVAVLVAPIVALGAGLAAGALAGHGLVPLLATGGPALALSLLAARTVQRRLLGPLHRLDTTARAVLAGDSVEGDGSEFPGGELSSLSASVRSLSVEVERARRPAAAAAVVDASPNVTLMVAEGGIIAEASPGLMTMLGRPAAWMAGRPMAGLVHPEDQARLAELLAAVGPGDRSGPVRRAELRLSHLQGRWVPTEVTALDLRAHPSVGHLVLTIADATERKVHETELVRRALHDPLTGLANRDLFKDHVEHALARLRRTPARPHAVLFVDLDGFKTVNDSLGHAAGDEVLVEVGARLRRWIRPGDIAARLGGDEFAVLLENTSQLDTDRLAHRILQVLLTPIVVQGKEVVLTGSIGIALSEPGQEADELLRNADVAMYNAKTAGKGRYQVFVPEMHEAALRRLDLEADLRRALDNDELVLAYQPIFDLRAGTVVGVEVLVRWQHPARGLIPPADFISVAEDSGLIRPLGRFVLETACHQVRGWQERFPTVPLRLCVNASVRQFENPLFHDEVARALASSGLAGPDLTLEITESLFMNDFGTTVGELHRLKELGLKLAVDDFGTGYSSLSYLRSLPIDILKIDKSFVMGVTGGPEQSAVARAVVKLSRTFNLQTVAEGIEEPAQAAALRAIGADMGQGYWYSRPLDATAMERFLADHLAGGPVFPDGGDPRRPAPALPAG